MIPFPKIGPFRSTVYAASQQGKPTLSFLGTPKLHGTNSAVVRMPDGELRYQSRNRVLADDDSHFGFVRHLKQVGEHRLRAYIDAQLGVHDVPVVVFGEWCGRGIQRGVAIAQVDPLFAVFAIRIGEDWVDLRDLPAFSWPEARIYTVLQFAQYTLDVDFHRPDHARVVLVETTQAVEARCPAGAFFDVDGVGEGVVWRCVTPGFTGPEFWFKVKGAKHSVTRVKTLAPVNVERLKSLDDFLEAVVTPARMEQGIGWLVEQDQPVEVQSTGVFLRWVFNDVLSEEADTLEASGLTKKDLGGPLSHRARTWFFERLERGLPAK